MYIFREKEKDVYIFYTCTHFVVKHFYYFRVIVDVVLDALGTSYQKRDSSQEEECPVCGEYITYGEDYINKDTGNTNSYYPSGKAKVSIVKFFRFLFARWGEPIS